MGRLKRFGLALLILAGLAGLVLLIEYWRGQASASLGKPGAVPVYLDGSLAAVFAAADLQDIPTAQFTDSEEGKKQLGWPLSDVLARAVRADSWGDGMQVKISSTSRGKSITLSWAEIRSRDHMVLLNQSGRGTLKLVSKLEQLDTRDEWIQDVDRIEVIEP